MEVPRRFCSGSFYLISKAPSVVVARHSLTSGQKTVADSISADGEVVL